MDVTSPQPYRLQATKKQEKNVLLTYKAFKVVSRFFMPFFWMRSVPITFPAEGRTASRIELRTSRIEPMLHVED